MSVTAYFWTILGMGLMGGITAGEITGDTLKATRGAMSASALVLALIRIYPAVTDAFLQHGFLWSVSAFFGELIICAMLGLLALFIGAMLGALVVSIMLAITGEKPKNSSNLGVK